MSADSEMYLYLLNVFVDDIIKIVTSFVFNSFDLTQNWKEFFMK